MLRRVINPILFLPLALSINSVNVLSSETKTYIDNVLEEKSNITFIDYQDISKLVLNNQELKSLRNLVTSSSFNLSSKIAKKYPSLDLQANGLPKYVAGKEVQQQFIHFKNVTIYGKSFSKSSIRFNRPSQKIRD